jgi:magnesium and cobalt transporter
MLDAVSLKTKFWLPWKQEPQRLSLVSMVVDPAKLAEQQLIENVTQLQNLEAADIMIPRADIIGIEEEESMDAILQKMRDHNHSRFPVYRETLDDIIGYIQIKKVFDTITLQKPLNIHPILEKPLFIVSSTRVTDLMMQMRVADTYLAVVVDEYGGIEGLVTIQDVVEAIFGTIQRTNGTDPQIVEQSNGSLLVDGRAELDVFEKCLGVRFSLDDEERADIDTVAGLVFFLAGHVPVRGEIITTHGGIEFEVLDADPRRIRWLKVTRKEGA